MLAYVPLGPRVAGLLSGPGGVSGASRTVELEVPASRLVAPTSATRSTECMASSKDTRERTCVGVLLVGVCV